jgi:chaperonin GroEL
MTRRRYGQVLLGSGARQALQAGMTTLADAVEPALGPHGRMVAVQRETGPKNKAPELLNDGAAIARRVWALPNRWHTMGLLLARHMAAQVEEAVGDGGSTAIVLARAIVEAGQKHIAAGCDPMQLRRGLEKALPVALAAIEQTAQPLEDDQHILALATAITGRDDLAKLIHECFEVVGQFGVIEVRPSQSVAHDREYIQGVLWNEGWKSSHFVTRGGAAVLEQPYVLCATHRLTTATQLAPLMGMLIEANAAAKQQRGLVVIAFAIEGDALNILVTNKARDVLPALAIHAPGAGNDRFEILHDLATLCGGKLFAEEAGDRVEAATLSDLGQADEVNAVRSAFTITGGKGRPAAIRQRITDIRKLMPNAASTVERARLSERVGKLLGGAALLRVGGATEAERAHLMARAEEAVRVVRIGMEGGIVPGGGAAYLAAVPALAKLCLPGDEAPASAILCQALRAPMSALARNAGYDPAPVVHAALAAGGSSGFDVRTGALTDMRAANIVDPLKVTTAVLRAAVSCAVMTLTTEALVHKPRSVRDEDVRLDP